MKSIMSSRIVFLLERWIGCWMMLASERDWLPVSWFFLSLLSRFRRSLHYSDCFIPSPCVRQVKILLHEFAPIFILPKFKIGGCRSSEIAWCTVCKRLKFADQVRLVTVAIDIRQIR